ncbi:hypothetical protein TSOC_010214 [Tetrabaena socialis]|uniref:phytol kinase n=1 Tax=Tetrabaena socialis TaxID=47790 RepID=A0A2J7ZTV2_9CHLO|nr:hypothetical protein TSOC_010214 [Tetrabaena socialis]|eukprot:PNH03699.1 hypothetical protein TSOC_010214 [Tetrabaena socialis]
MRPARKSVATSSQTPAALDRGAEHALRRLPALVDTVQLAVPDDVAQFRADVEELAELLATVRGYLIQLDGGAEGVAAAARILEDAAVHSALLRLMAAVLRWPLLAPVSNLAGGGSGDGSGGSTSGSSAGGSASGGSGAGGSGTDGSGTTAGAEGGSGSSTGELNVGEGIQAKANVVWETCGVVDALLKPLFEQPHVLLAALAFVRKLLRMHTLQCLARQFAAAAGSVAALTAQQARYVNCFTCLLGSLLLVLRHDTGVGAESLHASVRRELAEALRDSCVLEHAARLLLRLLLLAGASGAALPARSDTAGTFRAYFTLYQNLLVQQFEVARAEGQGAAAGTAAAAAVREVLYGRCVRHVALVHGVVALCVVDGGPAYGLPEDVQQAISALFTEAFTPSTHHTAYAIWHVLIAHAALCAAAPSPPLGARAVVMLHLRLARLAVASGDVWAAYAEQQWAGLPPHAGGARMVVPRERVALMARRSVEAAWCLLRERRIANPPAWAEAAGVECWRLKAATLGRNIVRWADRNELGLVGAQLLHGWVPLLPAGEPLPPAPPPDLAAVLAGGLLPCLERLLRRAGEEPDGPESTVVAALLREGHTWHQWAPLLEYGEPQQAAALVAALVKLLRRGYRAEASFGDGCLASYPCVGVLGDALVSSCNLWVTEGRQLARLLTYVVCEWLPALSGLALQAMAAQAALDAADSEDLRGLLQKLLYWLSLLVHRCANGSTAGAAAAGRSATAAAQAGGVTAADDAGGWRRLLLGEVRVVTLLGCALRLAQLPGTDAVPICALAECCSVVAAAFPDEVLGAASSAAWRPELLRALLPELREQGRGMLVDDVQALAARLEEAEPGGSNCGGGCRVTHWWEWWWDSVAGAEPGSRGCSCGGITGCGGCDDWEARGRVLAVLATSVDVAGYSSLAAALVAPAEARALLRTCSYRGCTSLAGDSEADARMRWCRFCRVRCYCCGECQLSDWREGGHKEACPGGAKPRPG